MVDIGADLQRAFDEGYEKGKADEHRWWSEHCANCTDGDRPQGEWINKGDYAECSKCGADSETQFDGVEPVPRKTKFCSNCGAQMKGADDD